MKTTIPYIIKLNKQELVIIIPASLTSISKCKSKLQDQEHTVHSLTLLVLTKTNEHDNSKDDKNLMKLAMIYNNETENAFWRNREYFIKIFEIKHNLFH